ncbi:DNA-directed RNA polymerase [Blastomyces gilchristii SLH14081]|uniref:DNA-directed RNA polymerase n=2 Tax=Blastomyces TaxID=229219 RepID=A0A179URL5_BLAGS|nr:DNA-directed RNA polymerase [Blastomyces gilchristii SLH14081]EGE82167.2 DNA-directed RNA polymerase [Blastomyces dermatitidis ATCC 18188]EQL36022.1 DNA-directed RNA polymerase [Blastomyces dermatitidis ATCC 26199]OAT10745.1 DNA-directed RNA polymerase [Blastomyces gilchristii SLH14081]
MIYRVIILILALLGSRVHSHMQMLNPLPIRSPLDPANTGALRDVNYKNPLWANGSNYPCKGYLDEPFRSAADYKAGSEYEMLIEQNTATHLGGSCQLSLSYDEGKSFRVIKSIIGGCPLPFKYKFEIPSNAPSGKAVFAWTWFNRIGNREMYMNCAWVTVSGGSGDGFDSLPEIFKANVDSQTKCGTKEGFDIVFPEPGSVVEYGPGGKGPPNRGIVNCPHSDAPGPKPQPPGEDPQSPPIASTEPTPTGSSPPPSAATPDDEPTPLPNPTPDSGGQTPEEPPAAAPAPGNSGSCSAGSIKCDSETTWSMCSGSGSHYIPMGSVAAGTVCKDGKIGRA